MLPIAGFKKAYGLCHKTHRRAYTKTYAMNLYSRPSNTNTVLVVLLRFYEASSDE